MNNRLLDKVAFITGGGSWIGKEIAKIFSREGAKVFIVGRDENKLIQTVKEIGASISYAVADVTNEDTIQAAVTKALSIYEKIDILVQNAGIYPSMMLDKMTLENWRHVIDINLTGTFIVLKSLSEIIKKQKNGRMIFISSIAGDEMGYPGYAHYTASKSGMNGLMRTAAIEFAKYHVTVNSIDPGNILNQNEFTTSKADMDEMIKSIPLGRIGKPIDVANLALFLASDESGFITGQNIVIDGGETIT
ncbi:MAG TPA: SDR family NAD(P)-dependent oxidoreductase [Gammaproteobacteria bacterium]|jgi:3-oxoacyl-[acyl-carrier protein] reductase|nr:SDR family NAD(P)-dependent oxidoreductase [Gammaproteobacteria bacterium]